MLQCNVEWQMYDPVVEACSHPKHSKFVFSSLTDILAQPSTHTSSLLSTTLHPVYLYQGLHSLHLSYPPLCTLCICIRSYSAFIYLILHSAPWVSVSGVTLPWSLLSSTLHPGHLYQGLLCLDLSYPPLCTLGICIRGYSAFIFLIHHSALWAPVSGVTQPSPLLSPTLHPVCLYQRLLMQHLPYHMLFTLCVCIRGYSPFSSLILHSVRSVSVPEATHPSSLLSPMAHVGWYTTRLI